MALNSDKDLKMFYSIKEVADKIGVNESTLRYWENEFPQLSPKKSSNGVRKYTKDDIKTAHMIYHLVKERKLTIAGARQYLKGVGKREVAETNSQVVERLKAIREELLGIKAALDFL